ncbi:MAG: hypothetical protein Q9186_003725 [Xanthomendoza sp. 1 TL-2023]
MTELLSFYKVQGVSLWGTDNGSADTATGSTWLNESAPKWSTLSAAVTAYPEMAHRALAMELGLDYEKIQASIEQALTMDRDDLTTSSPEQNSSLGQGRKRRRVEPVETASSSGTSTAPKEKAARRGGSKK